MFPPRFKRYSFYLILFSSFVLIFFNEFLIYSIHRLSWSSLKCRSTNCTSILLVADPQILGETFDEYFYSDVAIYDSDNYLQKTFARAFAFTKPDLICFLGDLLDEGSIASDDAYQRYVKRFNHIFKTGASVHKFHIPGDNDIGGEGHDYVTAYKSSRFQRSFNESSTMLINNRLRLLNINLLTHIYPDVNETDGILASNKLINIVLTHISVLSYPGLTMKTIMDQFKPNIIFSAHTHLSRTYTYPPQNVENLLDSHIVNVDLNNFGGANEHNFTEIMVPTSSYRMGVANIGYGYAIIASFSNFKEAMAMEILGQNVSFIEEDESESNGPSPKKTQKLSDEIEKFEFKKPVTEVETIDEIKIHEPSSSNALAEHEIQTDEPLVLFTPNTFASKQEFQTEQSLVMNKNYVGGKIVVTKEIDSQVDSPPNMLAKQTVYNPEVPEKNNLIEIAFLDTNSVSFHRVSEVEAFESSSVSEKLKTIFLNQMAEKKVYGELSNRLASVEKHIKKYGGGAYSKAIEELPLQVSSVQMFSQLEKELEAATKTALAENFNKTIYEKDIKQYIKILLIRIFDDKFFAHNVTGKSGGKVVLNKSQTLSCIYESIEKKFNKKKDDIEDTVFKAIDQLKDSLRKKYPKLPSEKRRKTITSEIEDKPEE